MRPSAAAESDTRHDARSGTVDLVQGTCVVFDFGGVCRSAAEATPEEKLYKLPEGNWAKMA
eukprot:2117185-Rhodomonas_salina.1